MPRASASAKRQQGVANHRDTRHENGLVGPGKRVVSKKGQLHTGGQANGHGNGSANGHVDASSRSPDREHSSNHSSANGTAKHHSHSNVDVASESRSHESQRRGSVGDYSETSSSESLSSHNSNGIMETNHRQIDVNATKNSDVHRDSGPLELAATVLKALPLYDTLAILIILMQVPPVALSGIYMLFTFLTFVPPVTTSSGMNINLAEIFDWHSTMPSLVTVLCMDVFILMIWLFLWPPIQHTLLDLAKPVIAVTLGGGTSSREGTSRSVTTCFLLVIGSHMFRSSRLQWSRVNRYLPPLMHVTPDSDDPLEAMSQAYNRRTPHGWIKSVLAIHILTQGIVRYIREWYIRREKGSAASQSNPDPEAGKSNSYSGDTTAETGFSTPDIDSGFQHNTTISSAKKRRKQSTQVRLQQPLWAALASTKIVMVKEYELSHAASESAGSNATDIHNLGNAPFDSQPEQIWISYIGCDEVCFSTSHFQSPAYTNTTQRHANGHTKRPSGIDSSKPFYVRVNNAYWQPTRIIPVQEEEDDDENGTGTRWTGDIYGLRPMSKYVCEFVNSSTDEVIFSASVRTTQAPSKDPESVSSPIPKGQQSLKPDSPATTLKTSIAANDIKLADEKMKLKALRKEWKNKISSSKKENDRLENAVQSAGGNDDKLRQKIQQQETLKSQADRELTEVEEKLKSFESAPEGINERKKKTEKAWAAEKSLFDAAQKEFKEHQANLDADVKGMEATQESAATKRNKIATRIAKVDNDLARITDANNRGLDEAERRRQERSAWQDEVVNVEINLNDRLTGIRTANSVKQEQVKTALQQLNLFHEQMNFAGTLSYDGADRHHLATAPQQYPPPTWNPNPAALPHYPTSMWPPAASTAPSTSAMAAFSSMPSMPSGWQRPQLSLGPGAFKPRGRSSSMLSDVSGFTQSSNADDDSPAAHVFGSNFFPTAISPPSQLQTIHRGPAVFTYAKARKRSEGGTSGHSSLRSGSGSSGSMKDPTSPT
jgi:ubiquitination network signaling protein AcrB